MKLRNIEFVEGHAMIHDERNRSIEADKVSSAPVLPFSSAVHYLNVINWSLLSGWAQSSKAVNEMKTFKNQFTTKWNKNLRLIIAPIYYIRNECWSVAHREKRTYSFCLFVKCTMRRADCVQQWKMT